MIRMSHAAVAIFLGLTVGLAGCCGGAQSHKCDFTPYMSQSDGGDAAVPPCGTQVCQLPQVCCLKKIAPFASCIDPQDFVADDCEMITTDPPGCTAPQDCDGGTVCCIQITQETVSCQPPPLCPGDGTATLLACSINQDCAGIPGDTCTLIGAAPDGGETLSACLPASVQ